MHLLQKASKSQRNFLMRLLIGSTTLMVSVAAYYSYQTVRNVMLESLKKNAFLEVQQGGDAIDRWLGSLKVHVETLANTSVVRSMNWSQAEPYLKAEVLRFNDVYLLAIGQPNGWCFVTGGNPTNLATQPYFQTAIAGQTNVSDPLLTPNASSPTIAVAAPIRKAFDINSAPSGEIHSLVRLDRVAYVVDGIKYGDNSYAFALSSRGEAIVHPNSALSIAAGQPVPNLMQTSDANLSALAQRMVNRQQGIELLPLDGRLKYVAYLPLKEANWSVALVIPRENLESQLRALDVIALVILGLAGAMIAVLWQVQAFEQGQLKKSNELLEQRVNERTAKLSAALEQLQQSQLHLIQSEKMSALGSLVAGVAHEINNPVNFIYGNIAPANEYVRDLLALLRLYQQHYPDPKPEVEEFATAIDVAFLAEDLPKTLASMRIGANRIHQIVLSLRNFSRHDHAAVKSVDIHEGIDSTLLILQHRLKANADRPEVRVIREYGDLPWIECYAGQLNQVFMNVLSNALDALDDRESQAADTELQQAPSTIRITTQRQGRDWVSICIADNGLGMSKEVQQQIFDPFFTTKPVGKGTGLGMSISYQVITEKHHGVIRCESIPGNGTAFWIEIPVRQEVAQPINVPSGK